MIYQETNSIGSCRFECLKYINLRFVPHLHKHFELVYVERGSLDIFVENRCEKMQAGDFALIFGNNIHSYNSDDNASYVCVFSGDLVSKFSKQVSGKTGVRAIFTTASHTEKYIVNRLFMNQNRNIYDIKSCLYAICGAYLEAVPLMEKKLHVNDELTHKILTYISEHYHENVTLYDLSMHLGYTRHYLSQYINSTMNTGFCTLINSNRVDKAKQLLYDNQYTMSEIAALSGFNSVRNFNRVFKEYTGVMPSKN